MSTDRIRSTAHLLLGTLACGALAAGALAGAGDAQATCASVLGFGNGNGCQSNRTTFAIALGDGAQANALTGVFGGAVAVGKNAAATNAIGTLSLAAALGDGATAGVLNSLFGSALQVGSGSASVLNSGLNVAVGLSVGRSGKAEASASGVGNLALQIGPGSALTIGGLNAAIGITPGSTGQQTTSAGLLGTLALNLFGHAGKTGTTEVGTSAFFGTAINVLGSGTVRANGILAAAENVFGENNTISTSDTPNTAVTQSFGIFGRDNTVTAGPGPFSLAGSVFQKGATVTQTGLGVNINGIGGRGAASTEPAAAATIRPAAAAGSSPTVGGRPGTSGGRSTADVGKAAPSPAASRSQRSDHG